MSVGSFVTNGVGSIQGKVNGGSVSLGEMTYGVSEAGANTYLDGINRIAINNAIKELQDGAFKVKTELEKGWQGASLTVYEKKLDDAVALVCDTLEMIKDNIESCVTDLVQTMADQDAHMLDDLEAFSIGRVQ